MKNSIQIILTFLALIIISCSISKKQLNQEKLEDLAIQKSVINYDSLKIILDSVHYYDQYFFESGLKNKEEYTEEEKTIIKKIEARHVENLKLVSDILDKYGWLGADKVGQYASNAFFLTIQHNDLKTQLKYLPLMKKAVKEGKTNSGDVAMLEDRMAIKQGFKQRYGTQVPPSPITKKPMVWPIQNPEKVDELRKEIEFPPMSEYLEFWDIKWDMEEHKQYSKDLEEKGLMKFYLEEI